MQSGEGPSRTNDPGEASFLLLAQAYREEGLLDDAIRICRDGLAKCPTSLRGRLLLGQSLLEEGALGEALVELGRVEREGQGDEEILTLLRAVRMPSFRTASGAGRSKNEQGPPRGEAVSDPSRPSEPAVLYLDQGDQGIQGDEEPVTPRGASLASPTLMDLFTRQGDQATADAIRRQIAQDVAPAVPGGVTGAAVEGVTPPPYLDKLQKFQKGLERLRAGRDPRHSSSGT